MPEFADSFWTPDYLTGLEVLYGKLQQGVVENQQILTIASMRAAAEETYGSKMEDIAPAVDRFTNGFLKDEGASVRKVGASVQSSLDLGYPRPCLLTPPVNRRTMVFGVR
jgi:hypothetical protein